MTDPISHYADSADDLPRCDIPPISASIRNTPEDFVVEEIPLIQPDGEGEHLWLLIEKRRENTADLALRLSRISNIRPAAVGYAGRKDKHALARQWFSLHLPGQQGPSLEVLAEQGLKVLHAARHTRKLKIGALAGNRFHIRLRNIRGDTHAVTEHLSLIAHRGVPNYFGEQRFGRAGGNLAKARAMFAGRPERDRKRRGLFLSAARSALFNAILAERVREGNWNRLLDGESVLLNGSRSFFSADPNDSSLAYRLDDWDIHPSGALWGVGDPPSYASAGALEREVAGRFPEIIAGLAAAGLRQERRALRLRPTDLSWCWENGQQGLALDFRLPAGTFATALLREIADYTDASAHRVSSDRDLSFDP